MKEKLFANEVEENLKVIRDKIEAACERSNRNPADVTLMGVSKTFDADRVNLAIDAGVHVLGENRVQELLAKKPNLHMDNVEMHLIGHLQTNKVKQVVGQVEMIQSVDSIKIAKEIDKASFNLGISTNILVEINIGNEENKTGFAYESAYDVIEEIAGFKHLKVQGLMCVPPNIKENNNNRAYFNKMNQLFLDIRQKKLDNVCMHILSMGMSSDFEDAIIEGSTMVRIGTSLFGSRTYL